MTQCTRRAGGFHAGNATRVVDAGEYVFVWLEDREQTLCLLRDQVLGSYPQLVELGTNLMRHDFSQLINVFLLKPKMFIAETTRYWGELAST